MPFPEPIKLEVKRKAHYRCVICKSFSPLHVHHIIPTQIGGSDTIDNAVPLCPNCHDMYGDNPQKRKWIKQRRDFWYDYCDKILNYDNLKQLEKTYNILEESMSRQDEKISNLERKIDILNNTVQHYSSLINNLIARLPYTTEDEKDSLKEQIDMSSNILAVSGSIIDNFSRKEKGVYYHPPDTILRMFGLKSREKRKKD